METIGIALIVLLLVILSATIAALLKDGTGPHAARTFGEGLVRTGPAERQLHPQELLTNRRRGRLPQGKPGQRPDTSTHHSNLRPYPDSYSPHRGVHSFL